MMVVSNYLFKVNGNFETGIYFSMKSTKRIFFISIWPYERHVAHMESVAVVYPCRP